MHPLIGVFEGAVNLYLIALFFALAVGVNILLCRAKKAETKKLPRADVKPPVLPDVFVRVEMNEEIKETIFEIDKYYLFALNSAKNHDEQRAIVSQWNRTKAPLLANLFAKPFNN